MSDEEVRLQEHLDRHPADHASRLVLADLLDERGDEVAARCQRWLAAHRLYPEDVPGGYRRKRGWRWGKPQLHAILPPRVQSLLAEDGALYPTRLKAEEALARVLAQLEQEGG